jgi:hypothetical protein
MKQYLITEELLEEISTIDRYTTKMQNRLLKVRSHPYQSEQLTENQKLTQKIRPLVHDARIRINERNTALDELMTWLDEQVPKKDLEHPFYECKTRIKGKIEELRQAGEQE